MVKNWKKTRNLLGHLKRANILVLLIIFIAIPIIIFVAQKQQEIRQRAESQTYGWRLIGPGNADLTTVITTGSDGTVYAGFDIGGVYKSTSKGQAWESINGIYPNIIKNDYIHDIKQDPTNSNIIWVGTRGGPFKSTDGGQTWTAKRNGMPAISTGKITAAIGSIAISKDNPQIIFAGVGDPRKGNSASFWKGIGKIYKSTNGGETWTLAPTSGTIGSSTNNILYVAYDTTNNYLYAATAEGLYRSTDSGSSWSQKISGYVRHVEIFFENPNYVWAAGNNNVYRSSNAGNSFSSVGSLTGAEWVATHPTNSDIVYVSTSANWQGAAYKTTNGTGSSTWTKVTNWGSNVNYGWRPQFNLSGRTIAIDPTDPNILYYGSSSQIIKSTNGGSSWFAIYTKNVDGNWTHAGMSVQGANRVLAVDPNNSNIMYLGTGDHGLLKSIDGGYSWKLISASSSTGTLNGFKYGKDTTGIAIDPSNSNIIWAVDDDVLDSTYLGGVVKSTNGGASWNFIKETGYADDIILDPKSPVNSRVLLVGALDKVYRSQDGGSNWSSSSLGGEVRQIVIDPTNSSYVYAASEGNGVFRSTDNGKSWSKISSGFTDAKSVAITSDGKWIYAGVRNSSGTTNGGVWKASSDTPTGWSHVLNNMPGSTSQRVESVVTIPETDIVYAATADDNYHDESSGGGIYRSADGGGTWTQVNNGLGIFKFWKLDIEPNPPYRIFAGSNGGGVYVMTDPLWNKISITPTPPGADTYQWDLYEIPLVSSTSYTNPYVNVTVNATFTGPNGVIKTLKGFWDGGNNYKIRLTPTIQGTWTYSITSSPSDSGLTKSGSFKVGGARSGNHGFLRRDSSNPYSFVYDDGTRYFMWGQTYYEIVRTARKDTSWQQGILNSKAKGMTKVRMLIYPWGASGNPDYPLSYPFNPENNHDSLDLTHWQKLDEIIRFMDQQGMVADLILFRDPGTPNGFGTQTQDERYVRYILARFAAYKNVIWDLTNEWEWTGKTKTYWNGIGSIVRNEDPWIAQGSAYRPLSIHPISGSLFQYFDASWPTNAVLQYPLTSSDTRGDSMGNYSIVNNLGRNMPVVNDEFNYYWNWTTGGARFDQTSHRNYLWGITVGGGYGTSGDWRKPADFGGTGSSIVGFSGAWLDGPIYPDIKRMTDFWTTKGIQYWKMMSNNSIKTSGTRVYVLSNPGVEYVAYAATGGSFTLNLPSSTATFKVLRYNPRDGSQTQLSDITGGGSKSFTMPDSNDWVLWIYTPNSPTPMSIASTSVRINAGGTAKMDTYGSTWSSDSNFIGGQTANRGTISIANTSNPWIYQTERYGMNAYNIPVKNGIYTVKLHFAETYSAISTGKRVFNVNVEGNAINNLDIYAQTGGLYKALVKTVNANVSDGVLNITFTPIVQQPEINGIEVVSQTITITPTPTKLPTPTNLPSPSNSPTPVSLNVGGGDGLMGSYFNNRDLSGNPVLTRVDPAINFSWRLGSPDGKIPNDLFSVRWTGYIVPKYSQKYTFYAYTDDGVRLFINNKLIINNWRGQPATDISGTIELIAGQKYPIKMEYFEGYISATAMLKWSSQSTPKQIVPQYQLFSSLGYKVHGHVFIDQNKDGIWQDPGETGYKGTTVAITNSSGYYRSTTTYSSGWFVFENVPKGTYTITATTPTGYQKTTSGNITREISDNTYLLNFAGIAK